MTDVLVEASELERRTVRRSDWVSSNVAFIDCRTPARIGSRTTPSLALVCRRTRTSSST
jgi:hypothetical protein